MLTRRTFARLAGASALAAGAGLHLPGSGAARAQSAPPSRGTYLIRNGAVITVDSQLGVLPRGDVLVRNGRIEAVATSIEATGAEVIDATDMIVMPGFIDTHYHMWSAIGRNFVGDGFGYFAAKNATSKLFQPEDFYNSGDARPRRARQRRHHHRPQLVAQHPLARPRRRRVARASPVPAARPLFLRPRRSHAARPACRSLRHHRASRRSISRPRRHRVRRPRASRRQSARHLAKRSGHLPRRHGKRARAAMCRFRCTPGRRHPT